MAVNSNLSQQSIPIENAGLVILSNYINMLLVRLDLVVNHQFKSPSAQINALYYLQYLVKGVPETLASTLVLEKIMCGVSLSTPILENIHLTDEEKVLLDGLLHAAIAYWPAIGNSSITSFRGNWLIREGLLYEKEDHWELIVQKRVYDILLVKAPFSFTIIKYPWMTKPIYVTWPY